MKSVAYIDSPATRSGQKERSSGGEVVRFPGNVRMEGRNSDLIEEYQRTHDGDVLQEIIDCNEGLIHAVLKRFPYFADPYEDIVQVARLGMIKAVQRFDSSLGNEFSSYATAIIDGEVRHHLRDSLLMRQPRWLRKSEKRIEDVSIELSRKLNRNPTLKELSEAANITEEGILEILRVRAATGLHPVDDPASSESYTSDVDQSTIGSLRYESFSLPIEDEITLHQAFETLSAYQKKIVYLLFYRDLTQTEVARQLGLSQRKVSRDSAGALRKLKAVLNTKLF